jgi:hypothetical protein
LSAVLGLRIVPEPDEVDDARETCDGDGVCECEVREARNCLSFLRAEFTCCALRASVSTAEDMIAVSRALQSVARLGRAHATERGGDGVGQCSVDRTSRGCVLGPVLGQIGGE